jgi:hypothetical protein
VSAPTAVRPVVTCPPWCVLPAGHDPDPDDVDGTRCVRHRCVVGDVEIEQPVVVEPDGHVDVEPLVVWLAGRAYDLARAQHLAADLAAALNTAGGK